MITMEKANIKGIMPAEFIRSGMYVEPDCRYICPPRNMLRPYCTGIRRWASLNTTINAMINRPINAKKKIPMMLSRSRKLVANKPGKPTTIPANMISEIPFPIPRSVINSPSQTRNIVPAVMDSTAANVGRNASPVKPTLVSTFACCNRTNWAKAWAMAMGTVPQWVIRFILMRPASPSRDIFCSDGITGVSSCMMIDAVIYGNTPRATMLMRRKAPPENRSRNPNNWLLLNRFSRAPASRPGIGMWATKR